METLFKLRNQGDLSLNNVGYLVEFLNRGGNARDLAVIFFYFDMCFTRTIAVNGRRLNFVPAAFKRFISNSFLEYLYDISSLHNPAYKRKKINDKKRGRNYEIAKILPDIKRNKHCHEKNKG